ncbi:LpqN/LpqT family lipoprotein [Mycolicibacterium sp. CR10]|uniref:LpqN/LpqT family lipoprotein n=1 Tax=Mycolicibacterium sp. CR10 TaxID=2562314 RepID=UPI001F10650F|nr:LpqN/LpqT family lipoprotein [Mycolicibacterium sp. CR10]
MTISPTISMRAGVIAIAAVALGIGLSGCGSDTKTEESTSASTSASATESESETSSSEAPTTSAEAAGPAMTIADYVKENNITEAPVKRGDPGAPTIDLPFPPGWEDMGAQTPEWAYGGIVFTGDPAMATTPPTIIAIVSKLSGNVDPAKILEYAPGEIQNLEGYEGADTGQPSELGGFDATQVGGTYVRDGVTRMIAQKTVVIPGQDGLFVLQLNADGTEDQAIPLMDATQAIDDEATITP